MSGPEGIGEVGVAGDLTPRLDRAQILEFNSGVFNISYIACLIYGSGGFHHVGFKVGPRSGHSHIKRVRIIILNSKEKGSIFLNFVCPPFTFEWRDRGWGSLVKIVDYESDTLLLKLIKKISIF